MMLNADSWKGVFICGIEICFTSPVFSETSFRTGNLDFIFNKHELFIVSSGHPAIGPEFGDVSGGSAERRHLGQNREKKSLLLGHFMVIVYLVMFLSFHNFIALFIAHIIYGIGLTFISGTDHAFCLIH